MSPTTAPLSLPLLAAHPVTLAFDGGALSSDAGFLPLTLADRRLRLTERLAAALRDPRDPAKVQHPLPALLRERIFLIAAGYADANDAQSLRHDPVVKVALGHAPADPPLAGQSTLSRLENQVTLADLRRLAAVLVELFVERCGAAPRRIVLDLDPFVDPAHGAQQGVLFNGHYDCHCYLPLYLCGSIDGGRQYVIGVLLRDGRAAATKGARWMLNQVLPVLQARFPGVQIIVRGDGAFGVPVMLEYCRRRQVDYVFGKPQNARLHALSEATQLRAAVQWSVLKTAAQPEISEFPYQAESWKQAERTICKAEVTVLHGEPKLNPRFLVTSLPADAEWTAAQVQACYRERGDPENRIKEFKNDLEGDRLSCTRPSANQFRLVLHVAAYLLHQALQDVLAQVAPGTEWARAQVCTLRVRLLKVAARVVVKGRAVRISLPTGYPWQAVWRQLLGALQPAAG